MRRIVLLFALLVVTIATPLSAVSGASVRLPKSAADWATFSDAERAAAYAWVWAEYDRLAAAGKLKATIISGSSSDEGGFSTLTVTGYVDCGFIFNNQAWGTYTKGWASVSASQPVFSLSTGTSPTLMDKLWRGSTLFNEFGAGGGGTYVYAESAQDFKWSWESVTYQVQSWGSIQITYSNYLFKDRYCGRSASV